MGASREEEELGERWLWEDVMGSRLGDCLRLVLLAVELQVQSEISGGFYIDEVGAVKQCSCGPIGELLP